MTVASWNDRQAGRRPLCLVVGRLSVEPERWIARENLIDAAWRENEYGSAEAGFYAVLRRLRRGLRSAWPSRRTWIECDDGLYRLAGDSRLSIDHMLLEQEVRRASQTSDPEEEAALWQAAVAAYRGPFLAEANSNEPWVVAHRARLEELRVVAVLGLSACLGAAGDRLGARQLLWSTLADHGEDERLRQALLDSYSAEGLLGAGRRVRRVLAQIDGALNAT